METKGSSEHWKTRAGDSPLVAHNISVSPFLNLAMISLVRPSLFALLSNTSAVIPRFFNLSTISQQICGVKQKHTLFAF
jgi:hypothetical protein